MPDRSDISRRRLLELLSASSISGIACCGGQTGTPETTTTSVETRDPSATRSSTRTETSDEAPTNSPTDSVAPEISQFRVESSETRRALEYQLEAHDDGGLERVRLSSNLDQVAQTIDSDEQIELSGHIDATPGGKSKVSATVRDQAGNKANAMSSGYARKYSTLEQKPIDIGAEYVRPICGDTWKNCIDGAPTIGPYECPPQSQTINRQIDLAEGFGINRWKVSGAGSEDFQILGEIIDSELGSTFPLELSFNLRRVFEGDRDLDSELGAIRDYLDSLPSIGRQNGRPVVYLQELSMFEDGMIPHPEITANFESTEDFVTTVRNLLKTADGPSPYLIGQLAPPLGVSIADQYRKLAAQFDGLSNNLFDPGEGFVSWPRAFGNNQGMIRGGRSFAEELSIDFIPNVYPGWNHLGNHCSDSEERIPRSPSNLRAMLEIALQFSSHNRINIHSFNDWMDGNQIEPGTFDGEAYDNSYLRSIKSFQSFAASSGSTRSIIYVSPDGSDGNIGSKDSPLETIQSALLRATPGSTVHVLPGEYVEHAKTVRAGAPDNPITITGPPNAVYKGVLPYGPFEINHSHIHIRGMTFDGLHDDDHPDDPLSYADGVIDINSDVKGELQQSDSPPEELDENRYLNDIVVKPHAAGKVRGSIIKVNYANNVEIGEFKVIGLAGADYQLTETPGHHGEIVYVGVAAGGKEFPWDRSHNIHVHHIDNSEGHRHSEIVNTKYGTTDVTIEYCTDYGGWRVTDGEYNNTPGTINLQGGKAVVRWNDIANGDGHGVQMEPDPDEETPNAGLNNSIYGNRIKDIGGEAIHFVADRTQYADEQRFICGNDFNGNTHANPGSTCPADVPEGDGVGHLGGDSPWAGEGS